MRSASNKVTVPEALPCAVVAFWMVNLLLTVIPAHTERKPVGVDKQLADTVAAVDLVHVRSPSDCADPLSLHAEDAAKSSRDDS
jgi:hypothetical protein